MICPRCGTLQPQEVDRCARCGGIVAAPPQVDDIALPVVGSPTRRGQLAQQAAGLVITKPYIRPTPPREVDPRPDASGGWGTPETPVTAPPPIYAPAPTASWHQRPDGSWVHGSWDGGTWKQDHEGSWWQRPDGSWQFRSDQEAGPELRPTAGTWAVTNQQDAAAVDTPSPGQPGWPPPPGPWKDPSPARPRPVNET
jgi:hypothetical protein